MEDFYIGLGSICVGLGLIVPGVLGIVSFFVMGEAPADQVGAVLLILVLGGIAVAVGCSLIRDEYEKSP